MKIKYFTSIVGIASLALFTACGGDEKEVKLNQTQETIEMGNKIEKFEDAKTSIHLGRRRMYWYSIHLATPEICTLPTVIRLNDKK
ncbi:MAG: hypothetical protein IPG89_10645 [Bacteroidetes bacterium]|nr:hypothetical protein [Bacteroidota bacterium]